MCHKYFFVYHLNSMKLGTSSPIFIEFKWKTKKFFWWHIYHTFVKGRWNRRKKCPLFQIKFIKLMGFCSDLRDCVMNTLIYIRKYDKFWLICAAISSNKKLSISEVTFWIKYIKIVHIIKLMKEWAFCLSPKTIR